MLLVLLQKNKVELEELGTWEYTKMFLSGIKPTLHQWLVFLSFYC